MRVQLFLASLESIFVHFFHLNEAAIHYNHQDGGEHAILLLRSKEKRLSELMGRSSSPRFHDNSVLSCAILCLFVFFTIKNKMKYTICASTADLLFRAILCCF